MEKSWMMMMMHRPNSIHAVRRIIALLLLTIDRVNVPRHCLVRVVKNIVNFHTETNTR